MRTLAHLRQTIFILVCVLVIGALGTYFLLAPHPKNLIIISLDSVRADHLEVLGYQRATMPALSAWAKDGAFIFTNYFATSYLTPISEVSVQTGQYPFTTGVVNFAATARPTIPLLAELLKQKGYDTAAFGSSPEYTNDALKATFSRGFDTYEPYPTSTSATKPRQPRIIDRTSSSPIDKAEKWLDERKGSQAPFYLWLPLGTAHMPYNLGKPTHFTDPSYNGPLKSTGPYDEFNPFYGYVYDGKIYDTNTLNNSSVIDTYSDKDLQYVTDRYDDGLYLSDQIISKLFAYLKKTGLDRSTIVVFESEHGETLGERGYIAHYDIYDETLHTPLIMRIPGMNGRKVNELMSGVDILPTLLSALHFPSVSVEGKSYLPLMNGTSKVPPRDAIFAARTPLWERVTLLFPYFNAVDDIQHFHDTAVRSTSLKLIHRTSQEAQAKYGWWGMLTGTVLKPPEYELYDVRTDPREQHNVYASRKDDPDVRALKAQLDAYDHSVSEHMPGPTRSIVQPYF